MTETDRREEAEWRKLGRADEDEPEKVRLLEANAPIACFRCKHPDAAKARKGIVEIIRAIRHRECVEGDLPTSCCMERR
jgi:hypothetical protein